MSFQTPSEAAQTGAGGLFAEHPEDSAGEVGEIFAEINITPLTDVILVLLIIFMVSSSAMVDAVREGRLDVALPQAGSSTAANAEDATLVVGVAPDGRTFVHNAFVSEEELVKVLHEAHQKDPRTVVIVDADGGLEHRNVVAIIDRVRAAGFSTVGIGAETSAP